MPEELKSIVPHIAQPIAQYVSLNSRWATCGVMSVALLVMPHLNPCAYAWDSMAKKSGLSSGSPPVMQSWMFDVPKSAFT